MKVGGEVTPETLDPFGIKVYELTESCSHIMDKDKASLETQRFKAIVSSSHFDF